MTAAALLTALRDVAHLGGFINAHALRLTPVARLIVHPALPALPRRSTARALAALRVCARSGAAMLCRKPLCIVFKRRRCGGGSVAACMQVAARGEARLRRVC